MKIVVPQSAVRAIFFKGTLQGRGSLLKDLHITSKTFGSLCLTWRVIIVPETSNDEHKKVDYCCCLPLQRPIVFPAFCVYKDA